MIKSLLFVFLVDFEILLLGILLWEFDGISKSDIFDKVKFIFLLLIFLLMWNNSADLDGCRKLIKRKKKNITFFDKPEINLEI